MSEVIFRLQTITPLFLAGGAYSYIEIPKYRREPPKKRQQGMERQNIYATHGWKLQAEIRAPSFRGLMRYWLRTAVAGLHDMTTVGLNDVIQFEQSVFGATDRGSAITLRLADIPKEVEPFKKESSSQEEITGQDYLFWSMAANGYGKNYKPERSYYPEGGKFKVTLSERYTNSTISHTLSYAVAAMWLLTSLGGIGSRSHRCAGSLMVREVTGNIPNLSFSAAKNKEDLQEKLQQGIIEIRRISLAHLQEMRKQDGSPPLTQPLFDSLFLPRAADPSPSPYGCRIWILTQQNGSPWDSCEEAMNEIGTRLQLGRNELVLKQRATFGLPLNIKLPADKKLEKALRDSRRTSPLLLRLTQLSNGRYVGIAVLFKTPALPILDDKKIRVLIPAPDYTLIEQWIDTFKGKLEVVL